VVVRPKHLAGSGGLAEPARESRWPCLGEGEKREAARNPTRFFRINKGFWGGAFVAKPRQNGVVTQQCRVAIGLDREISRGIGCERQPDASRGRQ
jgi:hypothetical protein